jgi:hypothetical protein
MRMQKEMKKMEKKGQLTIFIILAIIIVAVIIIIFYPRINQVFFAAKTPQGFIESCISEDLQANIEKLENQGGSLNPENYIMYNDNKVEYLCYTNEYYTTCKMQQPMLKEHFESELKNSMQKKAEECVNSLVQDYKSKGYEVSSKNPEVSVELVLNNIKITINLDLVLKKESVESYNNLIILKNSDIYNLISIAQSILNWEARYGDSAPETFMQYYPDLRVQKLKQGEGSKIYIVGNRVNGENFIFASRSLSWPAGYNVNQEFVK